MHALIFTLNFLKAELLSEELSSSRIWGMGNTYAAIADDDLSLMRNPAGLAVNEGMRWKLLNFESGFSSDYLSMYSVYVAGPSIASINQLINKDLSFEANGSTSFFFENIAGGYSYSANTGIRFKNRAKPSMELVTQTTQNFYLSYAYEIKDRGRRIRTALPGLRVQVGGTLKYSSRQGGIRHVETAELFELQEYETFLINRLGTSGVGYGLDAGVLGVYTLAPNQEVRLGLVGLDLGDTSYSSKDATKQKMNLTMGAAYRYVLDHLTYSFSIERSHLNLDTDSRKQSRIGMELKVPGLSVQAGIHQLFLTYGFQVDLGLVELSLVSYAKEKGEVLKQKPSRYYQVQVGTSLKF